jgi:hypothetical protein
VTNIEELQAVIRRLYGAEAFYVESVPVKETLWGKTVWEGVVEVFALVGHPNAHRIYAWTNHAKSRNKLCRHFTVLHRHPIKSARGAVRSVITREFTKHKRG